MKGLNPKIEGVLSAVASACFIIGAIVTIVVSWAPPLRHPYVDVSLAFLAILIVPFDHAAPWLCALSTGWSSPVSS